MPVFFFTVIAGDERFEDNEGTELPSLEMARREAIKDARGLMSAAILEGRDISNRRVEVLDEQRRALLSVSFAEALTRDGE